MLLRRPRWFWFHSIAEEPALVSCSYRAYEVDHFARICSRLVSSNLGDRGELAVRHPGRADLPTFSDMEFRTGRRSVDQH